MMEDDAPQRYDLAGQVIGLAMKVHRALGPGFLEAVYRNALCVEMAEIGLAFEVEQPLSVHYRGKLVGSYQADLIVRGEMIVEIKALTALLPAHEAQLVNYLTATGFDLGLLFNFGTPSLLYKRRHRSPRHLASSAPSDPPPSLQS